MLETAQQRERRTSFLVLLDMMNIFVQPAICTRLPIRRQA